MKQKQNDPDGKGKKKKQADISFEYQELEEEMQKALDRADKILGKIKDYDVENCTDCG